MKTQTVTPRPTISELKNLLIYKYFPHRYFPIIYPIYKQAQKTYRAYKYSGEKVSCSICNHQFNSWIGIASVCPGCGSAARHRIMLQFLEKKFPGFNQKLKVLHIAPWNGLKKKFKNISNWEYVTADLSAPNVDYHVDLTKIDFEDESFDLVICSHVLEHIPEDAKAMSEIFRILTTNGHACLQVPYSSTRNTLEDLSVTDPLERMRLFGQADHVRKYGRDLRDRLEGVGFTVTEDYYSRSLPLNQREVDGIIETVDDNDAVFWCSKI